MTLRTVDLFCGAGGSNIGASMAGAQVVAAIDADPLAARTFQDNFPQARVIAERLDERNGPGLLGDVGKVDLLLASPECTSHSVARGRRAIDLVSLRSGLFVLPFLDAWRPDFLILENVARVRRWDGWAGFLAGLAGRGYRHKLEVLDAQEFGVPQARRRMFLLASRAKRPGRVTRPPVRAPRTAASIFDPPGSHPAARIEGRARPLAIATLERIARGRAALPADRDLIVVYYGSDAAGGWQALDRPLRTVTTLDRFALVSGSGADATIRMLQVPELRRAMGFPEEYRLEHGTRRDRIRLLGNAVCPPVMAAAVRSLVMPSKFGELDESAGGGRLLPLA